MCKNSKLVGLTCDENDEKSGRFAHWKLQIRLRENPLSCGQNNANNHSPESQFSFFMRETRGLVLV